MKKILLVLVLTLGSFAVADAQKKGFTSAVWYQASPVSLNGHSELKTSEFVIAPGYAFNRHLFVRLHGELSIGLFDVSPVKTYEANGLIGGSVGYNIVDSKEWGLFEGAVTVGNTLCAENWRFMYYDAAVRWNLPSRYPMKLSLGVGVRYYKSHNARFDDFCNLYVGLGFRFN